jgi:hypothetical protein
VHRLLLSFLGTQRTATPFTIYSITVVARRDVKPECDGRMADIWSQLLSNQDPKSVALDIRVFHT